MTKDAALKLGLQLVATAEYLATDAEICGKDAKEERALIQRSKIAFEEALAQPEQEPVAMRFDFDGYGWLYIDNGSGSNWREKIKNAEPLYTSPPQRKWVGLTDEERDHFEGLHLYAARNQVEAWIEGVPAFIDAIEDKLREKNTYTSPPQRKPLPPQSPCEMTQAEGKMFKLGWLECEAAHGIKGE